MSEDSILMALEGMQRDISELRKELRSTVERLTLVTGHEIRLARIEVEHPVAPAPVARRIAAMHDAGRNQHDIARAEAPLDIP